MDLLTVLYYHAITDEQGPCRILKLTAIRDDKIHTGLTSDELANVKKVRDRYYDNTEPRLAKSLREAALLIGGAAKSGRVGQTDNEHLQAVQWWL